MSTSIIIFILWLNQIAKGNEGHKSVIHSSTQVPPSVRVWEVYSTEVACESNADGYDPSCNGDLDCCKSSIIAQGLHYVVWWFDRCYGSSTCDKPFQLSGAVVYHYTLEFNQSCSDGSQEPKVSCQEAKGGDLLHESSILTTICYPQLQNHSDNIKIKRNTMLITVEFCQLIILRKSLLLLYNTALRQVYYPSLLIIGGDLKFGVNALLTTVEFPKLTTINGKIVLVNCTQLTGFTFPGLTNIGGYIYVEENNALEQVMFPELIAISGADLWYGDDGWREMGLRMRYNYELIRIGFPQLTSIEGRFDFNQNNMLPAATFTPLKSITGMVNIYGHIALTQINFTTLNYIGDGLWMGYNEQLRRAHFPSLNHIVGSLNINNNNMLTTVMFSKLSTVTGHTMIATNAKLTKVEFPIINNIIGRLQVQSHNVLEEVYIPLLESIGDNLWFAGNIILKNINFPLLKQVGGQLFIFGNSDLKELNLPALSNINGSLLITFNPVLQSVSFDILQTLNVNGAMAQCDSNNLHFGRIDICILGNVKLEKFELPSLRDVAKSIRFNNNLNLRLISFCRLDTFGGIFSLDGNKVNATIIVCGEVSWTRFKVTGSNTAVGCNNVQRASCFPTPKPISLSQSSESKTSRTQSTPLPTFPPISSSFLSIRTSLTHSDGGDSVIQTKEKSSVYTPIWIILGVCVASIAVVTTAFICKYRCVQQESTQKRTTNEIELEGRLNAPSLRQVTVGNDINLSDLPEEEKVKHGLIKITNAYGNEVWIQDDIPDVIPAPTRRRRR